MFLGGLARLKLVEYSWLRWRFGVLCVLDSILLVFSVPLICSRTFRVNVIVYRTQTSQITLFIDIFCQSSNIFLYEHSCVTDRVNSITNKPNFDTNISLHYCSILTPHIKIVHAISDKVRLRWSRNLSSFRRPDMVVDSPSY